MTSDAGQTLSRVTYFRLHGGPGRTVRIEVHEFLRGVNEKRFVAVPVDALNCVTKREQLHVRRETESEALDALLAHIETLSWEEIFPKEQSES